MLETYLQYLSQNHRLKTMSTGEEMKQNPKDRVHVDLATFPVDNANEASEEDGFSHLDRKSNLRCIWRS